MRNRYESVGVEGSAVEINPSAIGYQQVLSRRFEFLAREY
jgi:hypothetical protein